jgi:hypothetical protein
MVLILRPIIFIVMLRYEASIIKAPGSRLNADSFFAIAQNDKAF